MTFNTREILLKPGEGRTVDVLGDHYTFKALGEQTGGRYGLVEVGVPAPSAGPPPHIHHNEEEAVYVLEGEVQVTVGDQTVAATPGYFAFVPRGTLHTFANKGSEDARMLVILSPAGFEHAFDEMAEVASSATEPPDMDRLMAIADRYGLEIPPPPEA